MAHSLQTLIVLLCAFALPACTTSSESEPAFGAEEMQAVVVGSWTGSLTSGGKSTEMKLVLEHAPPGTSPACSNRVLGVDPQCIDMTELGVKGTLTTADDAYKASPVTGSFRVMGLDLSGGFLELKLADGKTLSAQQQDKGFGSCKLYDDQGEAGSCTMAK
jgi:hypothetical protein